MESLSKSMEAPGDEGRARSLSDTTSTRVKALIRNDILYGRLAPGSRLKLADLASRYGISQLPIREAIRELSGENLISIHPHKGAVVRGVDIALVRNMYDIKCAISLMLVERAFPRITDAALTVVATRMRHYEKVARQGSYARIIKANTAFHSSINVLAQNEQAMQVIGLGWESILALRLRFRFGPQQLERATKAHRALYEALKARDLPQALAITREHSAAAREDLVHQMIADGMS